jgi:hypothetical protein
MNSHFRKDYAYLMTIIVRDNVQKIPVRYLNFDRKRKEYVFVEGLDRNSNEVQFRFTQAQALTAIRRCEKQHHIGYGKTKWYDINTSEYKRPRRELHRVNITEPKNNSLNFKDIKVGQILSFDKGNAGVSYVMANVPLQVESIETIEDAGLNKIELRSLDGGLTQTCLDSWLISGALIAKQVTL